MRASSPADSLLVLVLVLVLVAVPVPVLVVACGPVTCLVFFSLGFCLDSLWLNILMLTDARQPTILSSGRSVDIEIFFIVTAKIEIDTEEQCRGLGKAWQGPVPYHSFITYRLSSLQMWYVHQLSETISMPS